MLCWIHPPHNDKGKKNNSHLRPNLGGQQYKSCIRSTNKTVYVIKRVHAHGSLEVLRL